MRKPCQSIAFTNSGQGLVQPWAGSVTSSYTMVGVDALWIDTKIDQRIPLSRQILFVCGAASISDASRFHARSVR